MICLKEIYDIFDWRILSANTNYLHLNEITIIRFKRYVDWYYITMTYKLSNSFISNLDKYICYNKYVPYHNKTKQSEKMNNYILWETTSYYQNLSEDIIRKHKYNLVWSAITLRQKMTEEFIIEMKDYIDWDHIHQNKYISQKMIDKFKKLKFITE